MINVTQTGAVGEVVVNQTGQEAAVTVVTAGAQEAAVTVVTARGPAGSTGSTGPAGATGPTGPTGAPGSSTTAWHYRAKTTIITGNPTDGHLIWNNATQISATSINVSHKNQDGDDIELILGFIQKGQDLFIQNRDASEDFQVWKISGIPTLTGGGTANAYFTYPVTLVNSGGNGTTGFANNHQLLFGTTQTLPLHASTHASGGTDPITPSSIGAAPIDSPSFTGTVTSSGAISTSGAEATIGTSGEEAFIRTTGNLGYIATIGNNANIYTTGSQAQIGTTGQFASIFTTGANASIGTNGINAEIQSRSTFKLFDGTYTTTLSHNPTADRAIAFPNKAGTVAMTSDITGTNSGTNTGDETGARIASLITAATSKTIPVDADEIPITDSAASFGLKKLTFTNLKAFLKTYLDTLYVALTGNQTIAGNKTFSGQTELTGQAATNDTSAITRAIGDRRYVNPMNSINFALNSGWTAITTTGGGTNQANSFLRVECSNGTVAGSAALWTSGNRTSVGSLSSAAFSSISFSQKVSASITLRGRLGNPSTNYDWAYLFGSLESNVSTISGMVKTGTSAGQGWVGLECIAGSVKIIAVNGTSAVQRSAEIDNWGTSTYGNAYRIEVSGGAASCYNANGVLLGTLSSGCPTIEKNFTNQIMCEAKGGATTNQLGVIVQHVSFDW